MLLKLQNIHAGYGQLRVLFGIDLEVDEGELVTIVGANGAGKSTLLKTILGAVSASDGEVIFRGERITHLRAHQRVVAGIALSPEGRQVFPTLTVRENLIAGTFGMRSRAEIKAQADQVYELFPRLGERRSQRAGSMSGGEQQMLAVGRALMSQPRLLLVDELSLGLAPIVVENLYAALHELCDRGLSVIVVEQSHQYRPERGGRFVQMVKGQLTMARPMDGQRPMASSVMAGGEGDIGLKGGGGYR